MLSLLRPFLVLFLFFSPFLSAEEEVAKPPQLIPTTEFDVSAQAPDEILATQEFSFMDSFLNMLLTLGLVILLILIAGWALKRMVNVRVKQGNMGNGIKIRERRTIAPKATVYLLEIEGQGILVGESTAGLQRLGDVELKRSEDLEESTGPASFGRLLKEELGSNAKGG